MTMHATPPTPFSRAPLMGLLLGVLLGAWGATAQAQGLPAQCGALRNHYGPYDYRVSRGETLDIVERAHFTPRVEALLRGRPAPWARTSATPCMPSPTITRP